MPKHSRTNSTRFLGEVLTEDRLCRRCNYSLKGLHAGGLCPECGTPIPAPKRRVLGGDNLSDAPVRYLRKLSLGLGVASIGMCLLTAGLLYVRSTTAEIGPGLLGLGSMLWIAGVAAFAGARPLSESTLGVAALDHKPWLLGVRLVQIVWLFPALFAIWRLMIVRSGSTNGLDFALGALNLSVILAFLATVPALTHLNALATWAGDSSLAGRLHTSGWGIALCGIAGPGLVYGSQFLGPVRLPATVIGAILSVVLGLCVVVAVISVVQIASISFLAISSNAAAEARDARIAQKRAKEARESYERQLQTDAKAPEPAPPQDEPTVLKPTYRTGGVRIEASEGDDEIYDLAPEDAP